MSYWIGARFHLFVALSCTRPLVYRGSAYWPEGQTAEIKVWLLRHTKVKRSCCMLIHSPGIWLGGATQRDSNTVIDDVWIQYRFILIWYAVRYDLKILVIEVWSFTLTQTPKNSFGSFTGAFARLQNFSLRGRGDEVGHMLFQTLVALKTLMCWNYGVRANMKDQERVVQAGRWSRWWRCYSPNFSNIGMMGL